MRDLTEQLQSYAAYHRDRRNIATHFFGVPMIVCGVAALLSRPGFEVMGATISPATFAVAGSIAFYLMLDRKLGAIMAALFVGALWFGAQTAALETSTWLGVSLGLFFVGWVIQFVGHFFEGRKPAFVDDLIGLLVGPLFVVTEAGFALGLRPELKHAIEAKVGPTLIRASA